MQVIVYFWTARLVSIGGSTITAVVLPILVFQLTGSALQTTLLATLARRCPVGRITLSGLAAHLAVLVAVALAPSFWSGVVLVGLWQLCNTLVIINGIALRQQVTPDHLHARVNTTARMVAWGGQPVGAAVGGALAEAFDVRLALVLVAGGVAISVIYGWPEPVPRVVAEPTAEMRHVAG